jgi:hypothetical protein
LDFSRRRPLIDAISCGSIDILFSAASNRDD